MSERSARILITSPATAHGVRRLLLAWVKRRYGYVTGIAQVLLPDLRVGLRAQLIYNRLHLARSSEMTRTQREMMATVVNGKIGGAP